MSENHILLTTTFNPGPGWRKADPDNDYVQLVEYDGSGETAISWWVREEPVPPLPTEPRTSIAVVWRAGRVSDNEFVLRHDGDWQHLWGDGRKYRSADLRSWITGFEVLSEPRAVTAKAVLLAAWNEIRGDDSLGGEVWDAFGNTAREFGVTTDD